MLSFLIGSTLLDTRLWVFLMEIGEATGICDTPQQSALIELLNRLPYFQINSIQYSFNF